MKSYKKTIVVFGCTGTVGKYVMQELAASPCHVRGVLRHPNRAYPLTESIRGNLTYVSANLAKPEEVTAACQCADAVFLLTATDPQQVTYEKNVIDAARQCGVRRVIKLSAPNTGFVAVSQWHQEVEMYLNQTGMEYCCLRPYAFMQNWERNTFTIRKFGKFYGTMADAARNYVDARDVAAIAAKLLLQEEPLQEKNISITGPETISHYEMAERLSRVTGRAIQYIDLEPDDLLNLLMKKAKLPSWLANHIVELDELALKVAEPQHDNTINYLKKKPRLMNEYLQESRSLFSKSSLLQFW